VEYLVRFAYLPFLWITIPTFVLAVLWRLKFHKPILYKFPLVHFLHQQGITSKHPYKKILFFLRAVALFVLALLVGKPQLVDVRSKVTVEGIDIMLVLDVSGSMDAQDFRNDPRSRVEIAKEEAIRFVNKRDNDAIGLVIFAQEAMSRVPLTLDKTLLKKVINDLAIGVINPEGTVLATALVSAANRLKTSTAKSKIIILLTDGAPSDNDLKPGIALEVAKKLGIKIYTVGIGSSENQVHMHPLLGPLMRNGVNKPLLIKLAHETGGRFFEAKNKEDMRNIYDTIDSLEKVQYETNIFNKYYDIFIPFLWLIIAFILLEIFLSSSIWFSL